MHAFCIMIVQLPNETPYTYIQEGLTPLDVAKKKRRLDVMKFLEENGKH